MTSVLFARQLEHRHLFLVKNIYPDTNNNNGIISIGVFFFLPETSACELEYPSTFTNFITTSLHPVHIVRECELANLRVTST